MSQTTINVVAETSEVTVTPEQVTVNVVDDSYTINVGPQPLKFGAYHDVTNQAGSLTAQIVNIGTEVVASGIELQAPGRFVFTEPGVYSLTFSAEFENTDNEGHYAEMWVKYNGANYPDSGTRFFVPARKSATDYGYMVGTVNFIGQANAAGDYVELWWVASNTNVSLKTLGTNNGVPRCPAVIVTISQVR